MAKARVRGTPFPVCQTQKRTSTQTRALGLSAPRSRDAAADEEGHPCRGTRCVVVPAEDAGEGFNGSRREPVLGACVVDELISFLELNRWTVSVKS